MADYPFNLRGAQEHFNGPGRNDGEAYKSSEFILKPGVVYAKIEHHGYGDLNVEFVHTEGFTVSGAIGTIEGWIGGGAGWDAISPFSKAWRVRMSRGRLGGEAVRDAISPGMRLAKAYHNFVRGSAAVRDAIGHVMSPSIWTPVDGKEQGNISNAVRVRQNDGHAILPGKYRLEVKSQSEWSCRFIQPDLGQSDGPLADDEDAISVVNSIPGGTYVLGIYKSGVRPLLANFGHNSIGGFFFNALAVDGTHEYRYSGDGQFIVNGIQTDIRPGKEYLLIVSSDGEWNFAFTEGY